MTSSRWCMLSTCLALCFWDGNGARSRHCTRSGYGGSTRLPVSFGQNGGTGSPGQGAFRARTAQVPRYRPAQHHAHGGVTWLANSDSSLDWNLRRSGRPMEKDSCPRPGNLAATQPIIGYPQVFPGTQRRIPSWTMIVNDQRSEIHAPTRPMKVDPGIADGYS